MKITPKDPKAADIEEVRVNGKVVKYPLELDTDEGWVIAYTPAIPTTSQKTIEKGGTVIDSKEEEIEVEWMTVLLHGTVKVKFKDGKTVGN